MADKKIRSIAKTFSWRALIFVYWMLFGYIFTGSIKVASALGVGSIVPLFFYYFHERVWNKIKWGKDKTDHPTYVFPYEDWKVKRVKNYLDKKGNKRLAKLLFD